MKMLGLDLIHDEQIREIYLKIGEHERKITELIKAVDEIKLRIDKIESPVDLQEKIYFR